MRTRLTSRAYLLFLAFALMLSIAALVSGFAPKANALEAGSSTAPTIQSDKADYPPGATVTLTGSNWQPGESVHINVNDEAGKTWSRDVDVTADQSGNITDQFSLPDWFVATYSVTATGSQSGVITSSFTDADVHLEGQSNPLCQSGGGCLAGGWESGNLKGWKELAEIPLRLRFDTTGTKTVHVDFDHVLTSDNTKTGIQNLFGWTAGNGVTLNSATLTSNSGAVWTYTVNVNVTQTGGILNFKGNLSAGAHNFTGSSLALSADLGAGTLQISKPAAAPGSPDLAVTKTGPTSAAPGSRITYTLNYQNKATAANSATGVQLTDILPSGVTYVNGSCSGTCSVAGNEVVWNLGTLAKGDSGSRTLQVDIPSNAAFGATYTDTGRILSAENDASIGDNASSLTTTVSFNRNPNAVNDSLTTNEDTAGNANVLSNDTDPDGDTLSVSAKTNGSNGTVSCTSAGVCTYTPNANFNGTDSFTYTVSDGKGGTATGTVNVNVNAVNDTPSFTKGADQTVNEDSGAQSVSNWASAISAGPANESSQSTSFVISSNTNSSLFSSGPAISPGGTLSYTPAADKNGQATIGVKVKDDGGTPSDPSDDQLSAEQTFVITVRPVNDAPSFAKGPDQTVNEDADAQTVDPWATNISKGPSDESGQAVDFVITNSTNSALFSSGPSVSASGVLSYTPEVNKNGSATITLKIHDDGGAANGGVDESATQSFTITVNPVNDDPAANNDSATTDEDTNAVIDVLANDSDVDGDSLSVASFTQPSNGTVSKDPDGKLRYVPNNNFNGTNSFSYTVSDGHGGSATANVTIEVTPVNDAPVAADDSYSVDEDNTLSKNSSDGVLSNDTDVEASSLAAALVSGPSHGQLTLNPNGSFDYTPSADYNGTDSFTYKVCDDGTTNGSSDPKCAIGTVSVTVTPVNDAPVASDDQASTNEDETIASIPVLDNDSDIDGDSLTAIKVSGAAHGTVSLNGDGKTFSYSPEANFNGSDEFTYKADDGTGQSNTATVKITIKEVNDPPAALPDSITVAEDGQQSFDATSNDQKGPANESTQTLSVDSIVAQANNGTATLNSDGTITYKPKPDYSGPDSFTYKVCDDGTTNGTQDRKCSIAPVNVNVTPVNDAPVAAADSYTTDEDNELTIAAPGVLGNDSDIDSNDITAVLVSGPAHGQLNLNANGSFSYTPDANYNGPDTFTYKANDGSLDSDGATVAITVNSVDDAPVAKDLTGQDDQVVTPEDTPKGITLQASDVDSNNLTFSIVNGPSHGSLSGSGPSQTYTPDADYNGSDSFTFKVCDDSTPDPLCDTGTVDIVVTPVNDAPGAHNDSYSVDEDQTLSVPDGATDVLNNDSDIDGDSLTAVLVNGPAHGTLNLDNDGSFSYTPSADYNGSDSFTYKASDGTAQSDLATVNITVNAVNDKPVGTNDTRTTPENAPLVISAASLTNNDDTGAANESGQHLSVTEVSDAQHGTVVLDNGEITFTPEQGYNGTQASFLYRLCDDGTTDGSPDPQCSVNKVSVNITVTEVNDPPVANDDTLTVAEDGQQSIDVISNDSAGPDNESTQKLSVDSIVAQPAHGTATKNADGTIEYVPDADYNGSDSFTYKLCDDGTTNGSSDPKCAIGTVSVTVTPVNDAPVARNDAYATDEDNALNIAAPGVLSNDSDADGDSLTAVLVSQASHGTLNLNANGSFSYTPNANYNGPDEFTYKSDDGTVGSNVATVSINVRPVNDKPVANNDAYNVDEDTATNLPVLSNDTDADNDSLTASVVSAPSHGTLSANANGFSYTPANNYSGSDTFTYKANDGTADSNVATVNITVREVNDNPIISSVAANGTPVDEGSPASIKVTASDPDTPAADLRYSFDCNGDGDYLDAGDKVAQAADSASCSFDDGPVISKVNVRVTDGSGGSTVDFTNVSVRNVAPTITKIVASPLQALVNQNVTFTGTATDPSLADTTYGFNWQWSKDNGAYTALGANPTTTNPFVTTFNSCGQHSVSAKATDKDGGTSAPFSANTTTVSVSEGHFRAPLNEGMYNTVQKGQVIPVKITVGCGLTNLTGLTPSIQLLNGDKDSLSESGADPVETISVSAADATGFMRSVDGGYLYNLAVPTSVGGKALQAGDYLTIRVNPFGTQATPNPAGSAMYIVLRIRK